MYQSIKVSKAYNYRLNRYKDIIKIHYHYSHIKSKHGLLEASSNPPPLDHPLTLNVLLLLRYLPNSYLFNQWRNNVGINFVLSWTWTKYSKNIDIYDFNSINGSERFEIFFQTLFVLIFIFFYFLILIFLNWFLIFNFWFDFCLLTFDLNKFRNEHFKLGKNIFIPNNLTLTLRYLS